YLEAEFFLFGGFGYGLDHATPELTSGGPPPIEARKDNLDPLVEDIIQQFAYQEVGHLSAFDTKLNPPFDPYANSLNYLLASYLIPYIGLTGYVGTNAHLRSITAKR
ncbi:hypothetical protein KI387_012148, partial [Taxus chinensis]